MEKQTPLEHKNRLDVEMYSRGITRSRSAATDLIKRGKVTVNGIAAQKANQEIGSNDVIAIAGGESYVSRAGEKLAHALDTWKVDVKNLTAVDIGSSTGGFVDCLLRRGAAKVIAIDVGSNQLDQSLRDNPRVEAHEETDVRNFLIDSPADIVVADVSFISLTHILPKVYEFAKKGGTAVVLVKPQFEVGKEIADKHKGIITDPAEQKAAVDNIKAAAKKIGFAVKAELVSPIKGEKGNTEFLLNLQS